MLNLAKGEDLEVDSANPPSLIRSSDGTIAGKSTQLSNLPHEPEEHTRGKNISKINHKKYKQEYKIIEEK